jgi:hypothetical protein
MQGMKVNPKPPAIDDYRVHYLLLHLGPPSTIQPREMGHLRASKQAAASCGFFVRTIQVATTKYDSGSAHYLFRHTDYSRNDVRATRFAEDFLYSTSAINGPGLFTDADIVIYRIPSDFIGRKKKLESGDLITIDQLRDTDERCLPFPYTTLASISYIPSSIVEAAWRMTPTLFHNNNLHRAAVFLNSSQNRFFIYPGQIPAVLSEPDLTAPNSKIMADRETALHDSFKAVEAVIGEPSTNERNFFLKLRNVGIEPDEIFDLRRGTKISQVIRDMHRARDSKSAHGGTPKSQIRVEEMYRFQECARFVLIKAVGHILGCSVFNSTE